MSRHFPWCPSLRGAGSCTCPGPGKGLAFIPEPNLRGSIIMQPGDSDDPYSAPRTLEDMLERERQVLEEGKSSVVTAQPVRSAVSLTNQSPYE